MFGCVVEYKDNEIGWYVLCMSYYFCIFVLVVGFDEVVVEDLMYVVLMYDVGKIGIFDVVL